jgi:hypothetical protein
VTSNSVDGELMLQTASMLRESLETIIVALDLRRSPVQQRVITQVVHVKQPKGLWYARDDISN